MSLTYTSARQILQGRIADSSDDDAVNQVLDQAQREVARARRWPELMVRGFFNTVAAYETGTIATDGTTGITLTGGVFPTDLATGKYRFALSTTDPWYEVATRTSGTAAVLSQAYIDPNQTASSYIVYKSHYSLASTVDRVEELWLHDAGNAVPILNAATDQMVTNFLHYPSGPGVPTHYYSVERDSSGNRQILLGPNTPDDVYRVEYVYRKKTTDGTFNGNLDESRWPVILARASAILYEPEFYERSLQEMQRYKLLLDEEWRNENESEVQSVRIGQTRVDYPQVGSDYAGLMGFGRVADPS